MPITLSSGSPNKEYTFKLHITQYIHTFLSGLLCHPLVDQGDM